VQAEVQALGFQDSAIYPDTTQLKFVMLDEFFPMHSTHRNSFCRYIRTYYVDLLGVRTENVLTFDLVGEKVITAEEMNLFSNPIVDLTLLKREATNDVEKALKDVLVKVREKFELFTLCIFIVPCRMHSRATSLVTNFGFILRKSLPNVHYYVSFWVLFLLFS